MNKNDSAVQPGARYGTGTIAPHPSLHLPPQADADGGSGKALLPPIDDTATMSLLEANGANNVNDGIDWGETSSVSEDCERVPLNSRHGGLGERPLRPYFWDAPPYIYLFNSKLSTFYSPFSKQPNDDDLGLLFWDDMAPGSGTGDDPLSFGLGTTRTSSAPSNAPAPVPAAPQPPSPVARLSPMPVDGNASQVQQQQQQHGTAFSGTQAAMNGSAPGPGGDPILRVSPAAAQGQSIYAVQQANPAVQQVQANPQAQYQIQYVGGVPVLTQVVPGQQLQRRQHIIQAAQMMNPLQQLQFAQAQQLSQAQTARTQQQQATQAQAAQAQQLAQTAQHQKAQPRTTQQAQKQETASVVQRLYAPVNQTLQPQVQVQNQIVQQNPQLTNNGIATASPISQVDQSLNAVVSQHPQAATIPASAQVRRDQIDISSTFHDF